MDNEKEITALKAEVFDILEEQDRLKIQLNELENQKQTKIVKIMQLRQAQEQKKPAK